METDFDRQLRELARLDDEIEKRKGELKQLEQEYDDLNYRLAMYMEQSGSDSKKLDGINFIKSQRVFSKVEDKAAFLEWVRDNDMWDVTMMISAQKINSYCNELIENGTDVPPGVTPGFVKHFVQLRRT